MNGSPHLPSAAVAVPGPPGRSRPDLHPAIEGVYFRASDGLVTRIVAGYHYTANWAICTGGTLTH
jgi:hypothetical protein